MRIRIPNWFVREQAPLVFSYYWERMVDRHREFLYEYPCGTTLFPAIRDEDGRLREWDLGYLNRQMIFYIYLLVDGT